MANHPFEPGVTCVYQFDCQHTSEDQREKCNAVLKLQDQQTTWPYGISGARIAARNRYGWGKKNGHWFCHKHKKQNRHLDVYKVK